MNQGAEEWAKLGPERSPGTMVYCLSGHVNKPGMYEQTMKITLRELVEEFGGGILDGLKPKGIIPGGSSIPRSPIMSSC